MTEQEVLEFFESLRDLVTRIENIKNERESIMRDMTSIKAVDYEKPKITCTTNTDLAKTLESIYSRCERLDRELVDAVDKLTSMRELAYKLIALCNNARQRCILYDYYLQGKSWEFIQAKYHYARTWPFILRQRAVRSIAEHTIKE